MQTYKSLLQEFVAFKSVSTDSEYLPEITNTVAWLKDLFTKNGFTVDVVTGFDNPIVVARYTTDPKLETCLVYGHYDVQPADIGDGWESEPFTLAERNNRLYARGVIDNKGQVLVHIHTIFELIAQKKLAYNVVFLLEGNEETGSPTLADFLAANAQLLQADFALISDGELSVGHPIIETAFRGVFNNTVTLTTTKKDLHSGLFGGVAPSATRELVRVLAKLVDQDNKIAIPGFYDDVLEITPEQIATNKELPFDLTEYKHVTGLQTYITEPNLDYQSQLSLRPAVEITGLKAGYTGEGYRNAISGTAEAKVSFRITATQDPKKCAELFKKFIEENVPSYVQVTVASDQMSYGVKLDPANKYVERAKTHLADAYGKKVLYKANGATLPIVAEFANLLKIPQVLAPLVNEDCNMHGANENFDLDTLDMALKFSHGFFHAG